MVRELGVLDVTLPVPASPLELAFEFERSGFRCEPPWTHRFQLWFLESGVHVARWLRESGLRTSRAERGAPAGTACVVGRICADRGVPQVPAIRN